MLDSSVPFLDLKKLYLDHKPEFLSAIEAVIDKSAFIGGDATAAFEKNFATWVGEGSYLASCANGTDAITLAALALDLPRGSEALVPAMTYVATVEGLLDAGLKVRLIDVKPDTWTIDPEELQKGIAAKTKLLAPVHLYGQMASMDRIREIANAHHCKVLEDAAQAHGARWKGNPVGFYGDVATYSFYPGKNLGAFGDAGAVLSRDKASIAKVAALSNHGGLKKYEHECVGFNSRLDNLQAAVLNVKLKYLSAWNEARRNVAGQYRELLNGIAGLSLPVEDPLATHAYHLYVVLVDNRDSFVEYLRERGVECGVHYPRAIHQLPAFRGEAFAGESFPHAERLARHGVSLPMCPTLTLESVEKVAKAVKGYFG